ncbi:MAG: hypothetical protein HC908_16405 [Calothrix sp. SM1_7_51]|nr:hypothetical protein [Calothrix sp. SM1_7_51]
MLIEYEPRTKNSFNGILGYAQILKRNIGYFPGDFSIVTRQIEGLNIIEECGDNLLTLINEILDLAKIEAGKMELQISSFSLTNFLKNIVDIVQIRAEQKKISFVYQSSQYLPKIVQGDVKKIRQILMNLLSNAIKFTDIGGVTFKVSLISGDAINRVSTSLNLSPH